MGKLNKAEPIPIEAAVKYLIKQRDGYKAKLDELIPYTKRLEVRVRDMEKQIESIGVSDLKEIAKKIERLERENRRLKEENGNLIFDYHRSEWFKGMQRQNQQRQRTINELRIALNRAMVKLSEYEQRNIG